MIVNQLKADKASFIKTVKNNQRNFFQKFQLYRLLIVQSIYKFKNRWFLQYARQCGVHSF